MNSALFWIASKLLKNKKTAILPLSGWVSIFGLSLGVACLVVSMAVMSGFEQTLKNSVADVTGHVHMIRWQGVQIDAPVVLGEIKKHEPSLVAATAFVFIEGVVTHRGQIVGASMQGVETAQFQKVLDLKSRLLSGSLTMTEQGPASVLLGVGLARNLNLQVGDQFKMVIPVYSDLDPNKFQRRIETFQVGGILDLGKNEYNERLIMASLPVVQKFADIDDHFSGFLLKFKDIDVAPQIAANLSRQMGDQFRVKDWYEINENLFAALKIERFVIFVVIMIIVLAAAFNVASSLYINVVRKYQDLAILKAMGFTPRQVMKVFSLQGIILGSIGTIIGMLLGLLLTLGFVWLERNFGIIPGAVYKLDHIVPSLRPIDLVAIVSATLLLSWLATLAPARRGAKMTPVEGLRHE